ncbi:MULTISPECIES: hypothetical protein [unclassified Rathayibacter]|nr:MULTISPECIES: hypothetical protein [unclassified Rathayibacter]
MKISESADTGSEEADRGEDDPPRRLVLGGSREHEERPHAEHDQ